MGHLLHFRPFLHLTSQIPGRWVHFWSISAPIVPISGTLASFSAFFAPIVPKYGTLGAPGAGATLAGCHLHAVQQAGRFGIRNPTHAGNLGGIGTEAEADLAGEF